MSEWVDVRLSEGENGSFLFISNYQDDPVETTLCAAGVPMLGGHSLSIPARRSVILPLEWQFRPGIVIHYLTSELIDVIDGWCSKQRSPNALPKSHSSAANA